jgi:uncharacterized membrane protein
VTETDPPDAGAAGTQQSDQARGADQTFRAVLRPHRSLSPRGFVILMSIVGLVSFAAGINFVLMGAWPVFGFFGLDAALIYLAFRLNYRSGRLHEIVEIDAGETSVTRCHPSGRRERFSFNSYWVRVRLIERGQGRTDLTLQHHDRRLSFGRFLNDGERREVADALQAALVNARGGPRI